MPCNRLIFELKLLTALEYSSRAVFLALVILFFFKKITCFHFLSGNIF
nr:MAG TPA_asm: hypothetical protein [Caudoviricetes sp.]